MLKLALFWNFFIAEGGGIVWEFLVLRSGACMHKGGVGGLCLSSIMRCKRPRKVGEWFIEGLVYSCFFLKAFSYWSASKGEFVFVVNGKRECAWYFHACIVGITYHTLNSRNTFIIMKKMNSFHAWLQQHVHMYFIDWFRIMQHLVMLKFIMSKKLFIHFVVCVTDNIFKWAMIICMVCFPDHIYFAQTLDILNGDTNEK